MHNHFNPRSREGSDVLALVEFIDNTYISIHAPAKGATHARKARARKARNFNPRSREGSDLASEDGMYCKSNISIHAPAKGAT